MCECAEARAWREYWSEEAIRARLDAEVRLYQRICAERWASVAEDTKRDDARIKLDPGAPSFAELERRRRER